MRPANGTGLDCFVASFTVIKAAYTPPISASLSFTTSAKPVPFGVVVLWLPCTSWTLKDCLMNAVIVFQWFRFGFGIVFWRGFFLSAPNLTPVYMLCKQSYICAWDAFFMCTGICLYTNITVESAITAFWFPNIPTHFLLCIYPQSSHSASSIF